ncbi:hypothetical protein [Planotetraspora sp. GP83]|uniref:hypothetical protein n=1 Tax=Planotetraspora sp. GP83 TaxID=3156264 RepID=UPI00351223EC
MEQLTACGDDCELALLAGDHALTVDGDLRVGRCWFDAAYREAERAGDGMAMARAALGLGGLWVHEHRTAADAAKVWARQRHALSLIDPRSAPALRLRTRLAAEEDYRGGTHAAVLAAVAEARASGDPVSLAEALSLAHHCVLGPEHGSLRLELAQELIGEASRTGRRSDLLMGLLWRTVDLFLDANPHAERSLGELRGMLTRQGHLATGFVVDAIDVMLTIRKGQFAEAEALAAACAESGAAADDLDATAWYGGQLATIRWFQGRIGELIPFLAELVNSPTLSATDNSYFAVLAVAAATTGDRRLAESTLARLRGRDLARLPRSSSWLISMYGVAEAACLLGETDAAAEAYALLEPFAHLPVIASLGVTCLGSAHHPLGVASLANGDLDRAVRHLRSAVHDNLALGHWPAVALSRWRLGQVLALRDGPGDRAARNELALAAREAAGLGMALPGDLQSPDTAGSGSGSGRVIRRASPVMVCRRRGRRWQIDMGARGVTVDHSVGMAYLATLLSNPGQEIPATELAAGAGSRGTATPESGGVIGGGISAQPVLDERAVSTYKLRLSQLQAEIDESESLNDLERAAALRAERGWLLDEVAAATGMAGRWRTFTGNDERARVAVGKAIRRAIARVAQADSVIGDALQATIHTGLRCYYLPK